MNHTAQHCSADTGSKSDMQATKQPARRAGMAGQRHVDGESGKHAAVHESKKKHTSNDDPAAIRQQNMTTSFRELRHVIWREGVASCVVDGGHLALRAIVHLHIDRVRLCVLGKVFAVHVHICRCATAILLNGALGHQYLK